MDENENRDDEYVPCEKVSYSFLFFLISGATLLVTLWAFWDDEYTRRGYKEYQETYVKTEYARAEAEWNAINEKIASKENKLKTQLSEEAGRLETVEEYQDLVDDAWESEITLAEAKEEQKFAGSRLDEAYFYYKKAMHEGENFDVQLARVKEIENEIQGIDPIIEEKQLLFDRVNEKLLSFKAKQVTLQKDLEGLLQDRDQLELTLDYYKPFPFIWKPAEILQTVIPGFGFNSFSEIIYRVDRCMTCHISYQDPYYKDFKEPLTTHPNLEILIEKHPPGTTGCTWCHLGQGTATAPAEHAHGSHHETDQTAEVNEPILLGDFMQSNCRNCHADVVDLAGAPILSKGKRLFIELGCHGCHLADGYANEPKVGPSLTRIAAKVNPSWMFRWVKNPKEYLPKTRMPDFGFDDKDALAAVAYLVAASEKDYQLPEKFEGGDAENGEKLFQVVGCKACHQLDGDGELFGPDLSRISNKVNADWMVSWLSNPKKYNHKSKMPDLRLSKEEGSDIAAYMIQFGKPKHIAGIEERISHPKMIEYGEKVVRRRGCFACHDINGMEKQGRIAPELSSFGRKLILELEFGDSHIPHTWESWARTKLEKPDSFRTERVLDKMPNFHLAQDEIDALMVLLKGFNGTKIPHHFKKELSPKEKALETGRRLTRKYNCTGCHSVEGEGGRIQKYLKGKHLYPPPLDLGAYHVGERVKPSWLYSFLKNPTPVRTWLKTKMPTFYLSDQEVRDFTAYFEALSSNDHPYESGVHIEKSVEAVEKGVEIVNYMDCGKCHDDGEKGIDFSIASGRLKEDWIPGWLKNTRELIPWTKMPSHWDKEGDKYLVKTKFDLLQTVGTVDQQVDYITDFVTAYNTADFDDSLVLGEEAGEEDEEEEGAEEEEEDSEDEGEEDGEEDSEDDFDDEFE